MKKNIIILIIFLISTFYINYQSASEILLYADDISYDSEENIIAKGKAKVIYENKIISSDLIIYSKKNGNVILPLKFSLKDEKNNYYYGDNGIFTKNLENGTINEAKILLEDGSRIVGKSAKRSKDIDIITKGVYSPCKSRIKIANFLCPIWQLEGEKILHDSLNLFLYQKHSKMRVMNLPVFYTPYIVTPSPLRKKRKSGFLSPSISLNFFDTKITQSTSLPYYFNINIDKELTFTPTVNYGGGIDSSQRFNFDYNQIISGGKFSTDLTIDTTIENQNSNKWLKEASLINKYNQKLNKKFYLQFSSALQTSKNYIQQTKPNDDLSYSSSLNTTLTIDGYNLNKIDDKMTFILSSYQSLQNNENNGSIPTILPFITYNTGINEYKKLKYNNTLQFYNIFRDEQTTIHSKRQTKISTITSVNSNFIKKGTDINISSNLYNQFYDVFDKKIGNENVNSQYFRSFPIFGITAKTPFKFKSFLRNITYTPKISLVLSPGISNTDKISNEDSSVNSYTIENNSKLNRYTGTDKMDNSKRINYSFEIKNDFASAVFWQSYEFTNNSNFHYSQGNEKKLSDFLTNILFNKNNLLIDYSSRYDPHKSFVKGQDLVVKYDSNIGSAKLHYLDQKSKVDEIITTDNETLNYDFSSKKIKKYSKISYSGLYDLDKEMNKESGIKYSYFDECFGINIDFKRKSYEEDDLKPQDILTIMFSFKNVGSYRSTNLAVSENDKQDIQWDSEGIDNELFN